MLERLLQKMKSAGVVERFVYINVAVYIIVVFIGVFSVLFNACGVVDVFMRLFELPASISGIAARPWSFFVYMFLHGQLLHILWNMVALYVFGKIFVNFYSIRHFVGVYILGGLVGGLFFVLAYNSFPYFRPMVNVSSLVGASASVLAIVVALAMRSPNYRIRLMFVGDVKLSTVAVVAVLMSFFMLSGDNAGGGFAHRGGVFAGWLVAYMLNKGVDITAVINKPIDWIATIFSGKRVSKKRKPKFTYSPGGRSADYRFNEKKKADEAEIDAILDKIKKGGYASLSEAEKQKLFRASSK